MANSKLILHLKTQSNRFCLHFGECWTQIMGSGLNCRINMAKPNTILHWFEFPKRKCVFRNWYRLQYVSFAFRHATQQMANYNRGQCGEICDVKFTNSQHYVRVYDISKWLGILPLLFLGNTCNFTTLFIKNIRPATNLIWYSPRLWCMVDYISNIGFFDSWFIGSHLGLDLSRPRV